VVRATNRQGEFVAFAYDIPTRRKYPDIELTNLSGRNGYCTISRSGRYVFFGRRDSGRIRPILASAVRLRIKSFWKI